MIPPVLILGFNRPEKIKVLIQNLRVVKPSKIFVSLDGPRRDNESDLQNIHKVKIEIEKIDWECEVYKNYSNVNLGCKVGVFSGISWFFGNVEFGIILEDDIIPNATFYPFCQELLVKFQFDNKIGMIAGSNLVSNIVNISESYTFSNYANIWGWATWKRAWEKMDLDLVNWKKWKSSDKNFKSINDSNKWFKYYWLDIFDAIEMGKIDTWDFQWFFTLWLNNQLCIVPRKNLVLNIGFGSDATHTDGDIPAYISDNPPTRLKFPLCHPKLAIRNKELDIAITQNVFKISLFRIIKNKLSRIFWFKTIWSFLKYFLK